MNTTLYVEYRSKKYPCIIEPAKEKGVSLVTCEVVGVKKQEFDTADILLFVAELPDMIESVQKHQAEEKRSTLQLRISPTDHKQIEQRAKAAHKTVSAYVREKVLM